MFHSTRAGRWILDNFPHTREQFNLMVERGILPDNLVCLKDGSENEEFLLKRWYKLKRQGRYLFTLNSVLFFPNIFQS